MTQTILILGDLLLLLILLACLLIIHKVRKLHLMSFKHDAILDEIRLEAKHLFSQLQAYAMLDKRISLGRSLPPMRGWAASPDILLAIAEYALDEKPMTCMECSSGISTVVLARCMQLNGKGHVYSLEHAPFYAQRTRNLLRQHGLEAWATIVDAPLVDIEPLPGHRWYSLQNLPELAPVDLLVIDGPPHDTCAVARYPALGLLQNKMGQRFTVFLDDADRSDEQVAVKRWLAEVPGLTSERIDCEKGCVRLDCGRLK